ncbi:uncharacterized protein LY79DRAFT_398936 [Colletotrichum navitas]|uniref:Uncharacterized protein n=1 Tax=Colletotrichum navitas TaxID=681940 RepID=A0AAD8PPD5_9PEZI|nr:uncharacterized protein LY79DRAFT_398936 [Colletotrichum navitas]KAK1573767.1 hypothetical protein LY79DRAFT_398936 [Colletotrichum navitas]
MASNRSLRIIDEASPPPQLDDASFSGGGHGTSWLLSRRMLSTLFSLTHATGKKRGGTQAIGVDWGGKFASQSGHKTLSPRGGRAVRFSSSCLPPDTPSSRVSDGIPHSSASSGSCFQRAGLLHILPVFTRTFAQEGFRAPRLRSMLSSPGSRVQGHIWKKSQPPRINR